MASPSDPMVRIEGLSAINGPASINAVLLDLVTSAGYEGVWVPWLFTKQGSLEISGTFATLSCQLWGTNAINPLNSYTVTITGSATAADVITLTFVTVPGTITASYTVAGGNTVTQMAAGLVAAVLANQAFAQQGIQATNVAGVVTVTWPSPAPFYGQGAYSTNNPGYAPNINLTAAVTGSATESVAIAPGAVGSSLGSAITAAGMTQFTFSSRWLKLRITTLTGGNVSAVAQGTA